MKTQTKIILGVLALVVLGLGIFTMIPPVQPAVGVPTTLSVADFPNGATNGGVFVNWVAGTIGAGQNQAYWKNTTGGPVVVDLAEAQMTATATSGDSYLLSVSTSTAATISNSATPYASLIDSKAIATSSPAYVVNSIVQSGNGLGEIILPFNQYVVFLLRSKNGTVAATSTSRGFNLNYRLRYHQ